MKNDIVIPIPVIEGCEIRVTIDKNLQWCEAEAIIVGVSLGSVRTDISKIIKNKEVDFSVNLGACKGSVHLILLDNNISIEVIGKMYILFKGWVGFDKTLLVPIIK